MEMREREGFGGGGLELGFPVGPMGDSASRTAEKRSLTCNSKRSKIFEAQLGQVEQIRVVKRLLRKSQNRMHTSSLRLFNSAMIFIIKLRLGSLPTSPAGLIFKFAAQLNI